MTIKPKHWFAIGSGIALALGAFLIFNSSLFSSKEEYVKISSILLFGLGLTVVLMAILAIVYSFLKLDNPEQPLGLPDGSVRALLAFSLVLIFICLATFLFSSLDKDGCKDCGKTMARVDAAGLADLKNDFRVAAERAHDDKGNLIYEKVQGQDKTPVDDFTKPLYDVTYYPKANQEVSEFAKQIFTTLATVFVSVVSFYFGSSVANSAVAIGVSSMNKKNSPPDDSGKEQKGQQPNTNPASPSTPAKPEQTIVSPPDEPEQTIIVTPASLHSAQSSDLQS
ncbi:hypothetical protein [Silvibacterium acidisoli]|uniref:hypothetical protein n=1 Tax=Acidobacteriaceae bacterium ZG23-2 TaxID=2883246 RepID=UPI00406C8C33